jgi:hypothetical protein
MTVQHTNMILRNLKLIGHYTDCHSWNVAHINYTDTVIDEMLLICHTECQLKCCSFAIILTLLIFEEPWL